jgi:hypothetical protein
VAPLPAPALWQAGAHFAAQFLVGLCVVLAADCKVRQL